MTDQKEQHIAIFRGKEIRKAIHNNEWWFSISDVIEALTGNARPRKYWNDLKNKLIKEGYNEVSEKIGQLKEDESEVVTNCHRLKYEKEKRR